MKLLHHACSIFIICGLTFCSKTLLAEDFLYAVDFRAVDLQQSLFVSGDNGSSFSPLTTTQGLADNNIKSIRGLNSLLYVLTETGIAISTDGTTFSKTYVSGGVEGLTLDRPDRLKVKEGLTINNLKKENVYFGSSDGLYYFNEQDFKHFSTANGLNDNFIYSFIVGNNTVYTLTSSTANGRKLSVSTDGGVSFNTQIIPHSGTLTNVLTEATINNQQLVYVATTGGLLVFNKETAVLTTYSIDPTSLGLNNTLPSNKIQDVKMVNNIIYIATDNGLSVSADGGQSFLHYRTGNGLASNDVRKIDVVNNIVYLTTTAGFAISNGNISNQSATNFINFNASNGIGGFNIKQSFFGIKNGNFSDDVYVLTEGGLAVSTNKGISFTLYNTSNGLVIDTAGVFKIVTKEVNGVSETVIYMASNNGVSVLTDSGATLTNYFTNNKVFHLTFIQDDFFIVTDNGLEISTDNGASFTNRGFVGELENFGIGSVIDNNSQMRAYSSEGDGMSFFFDNAISPTVFTTTNGLASNVAYFPLHHDTQIYIPTDNGLSIFNENTQTFNTQLAGQNILAFISVSFGLLGDANEDSFVNVSDILKVIDIILGNSANTNNADCNQDSSTNISDILCIIALIQSGS